MKGKNVLVTGGTGFVGSHIVEALLSQGANVFVTYRSFDTKTYFFFKGLDKKSVMDICDLKDKERVFDIISKREIDYIFHIAAQPIIDVAYNNPYETLVSNIVGAINVLEASRLSKNVKGILVFTSDKAYGKHDQIPYKESNQLKGDHPYDCSKSCEDLIAQMYHKTYNLPVVIVRSGNIFGPGDLNFNRIIPGALQSILLNQTLNIRSDGKMIREYVYVKEVAKACISLMESLDKTKGEAFNLGSSNIFNVLEVVEQIEKITGNKINKEILNIAKNEIPKQHLDYSKIKNTIGWNHETDFASAVNETFKWYQEFYKGANKNGN